MELGLRGKVALVAAASQGMGRATAMTLAREGCRVAICARNAGPLEATAKEIREATGTEVLAVALICEWILSGFGLVNIPGAFCDDYCTSSFGLEDVAPVPFRFGARTGRSTPYVPLWYALP